MPHARTTVWAVLAPLFYLLTAAALAALLAYPLFLISGSESLSLYRSLVSRGGQALLILGLIPLAKRLELTRASLGFGPGFARPIPLAFALGTAMLGAHVTGLIALDLRIIDWEGMQNISPLSTLLKAGLIGFAVALLEETLFRGALLGFVQRLTGPLLAVIVSALYYAALHFIGSQWSTDPARVGWDTGFRIAFDGFGHLSQADPSSFIALFVAGLFLGTIRVISPQGLGYCIGLHAGWVFTIKSVKKITWWNHWGPHTDLVGSYDGFVGTLSALWLAPLTLLVILGVRFIRSHPRRESHR